MAKTKTFFTPLRYPGGKQKLANFIKLVLRENSLFDGHYAEPYAGGAGVAFELLLQGWVSDIYINDIDPGIHAFWYSILNHPEEFCRLVKQKPLTVAQWKKQKKLQTEIKDPFSLALGFSTFYLNRTNRSGVIKGGVIGGYAQDGLYKINARFNREDLINRIQKISLMSSRVHLTGFDAIDCIKKLGRLLPKQSLIYLDPPYYVKGGYLYRNFYRHEDHQRVANAVACLKQNWIVSYDNVQQINDIYSKHPSIVYDLNYSAAGASKGSESMFFSPGLIIPKVNNPSRVVAAW